MRTTESMSMMDTENNCYYASKTTKDSPRKRL